MRNFQKLAVNMPVMPLAHALQRHPELWNADRQRTSRPQSAMAQVDDILLHFGKSREDFTHTWHPAYYVLHQVRPLLSAVRAMVDGYSTERVLISRLQPGARVLPHVDTDGYAGQGGIVRYHLIVQGLGGNLYRCGREVVDMATGELWWFDPTVEHECSNEGTSDRIHLMADFRLQP